jgi:hypothetical protein
MRVRVRRHDARAQTMTLSQVLLIATVAVLMPRAPPPGGFGDAALRGGGGAWAGPKRYAVVVDAGSTGSRVHAFAFAARPGGELELLSDTFEQLKPGLSSYAAAPTDGAASLRPLLDAALAAIPADAAAATPVEVRATAGLRMLPGAAAEDLLTGAWLRARTRTVRSCSPRAAPHAERARVTRCTRARACLRAHARNATSRASRAHAACGVSVYVQRGQRRHHGRCRRGRLPVAYPQLPAGQPGRRHPGARGSCHAALWREHALTQTQMRNANSARWR